MTSDKRIVLKSVKTILFALLIAHCSNLIAQEQTLNSTPSELSAVSGTLKVLSYNIHMLPPLAKFTGKQRRAKRIGDILKDSDFDIVVFQEAFHAAARRKIKHRMKANYPHILGPANRRWYSLKTNSGIWILSKIPLTQVAELISIIAKELIAGHGKAHWLQKVNSMDRHSRFLERIWKQAAQEKKRWNNTEKSI